MNLWNIEAHKYGLLQMADEMNWVEKLSKPLFMQHQTKFWYQINLGFINEGEIWVVLRGLHFFSFFFPQRQERIPIQKLLIEVLVPHNWDADAPTGSKSLL